MIRSLLIFVFLVSGASFASASCGLEAEKFEALMALDFDAFDQKPAGWRSLDDGSDACQLTIAILIDSYHLSHQATMLPWQDRLSYWHAGQYYAFLGLRDLAVQRFSKSFDPGETADPGFHWNAYARATIAFMNRDRAALEKARDEFTKVNPLEMNNFKIVERFLRCFQATYYEAYSGTGTCQ